MSLKKPTNLKVEICLFVLSIKSFEPSEPQLKAETQSKAVKPSDMLECWP